MLSLIIYTRYSITIIMAEYLKRLHRRQPDEEEYYHWQTICPDYPRKGKETIMVFKDKPSHFIHCPRCAQLDKS